MATVSNRAVYRPNRSQPIQLRRRRGETGSGSGLALPTRKSPPGLNDVLAFGRSLGAGATALANPWFGSGACPPGTNKGNGGAANVATVGPIAWVMKFLAHASSGLAV
jgi:hypothetical protein